MTFSRDGVCFSYASNNARGVNELTAPLSDDLGGMKKINFCRGDRCGRMSAPLRSVRAFDLIWQCLCCGECQISQRDFRFGLFKEIPSEKISCWCRAADPKSAGETNEWN